MKGSEALEAHLRVPPFPPTAYSRKASRLTYSTDLPVSHKYPLLEVVPGTATTADDTRPPTEAHSAEPSHPVTREPEGYPVT